jgi:hypothetical protein
MSEISRLFARAPNSQSQTDLAEVMAFLASTGYKKNFGDDLEIIESSPAAMSVTLQTGKAWIEGYYYYNDADLTVNIDAADGALNRIDRVVLRCDYLTNLEITCEVVKGTAAATPTAPALTRAGGIYEISLAQIYVGAAVVAVYTANITDERDDASVCGVAQGLEVAKVGILHTETLPILNGASTVAGRHPAASLYGLARTGNDLYFIGGNAGTYDAVTSYIDDTWTTLTSITTPRRYAPSATYYDGKIYVIGGANAAAALLATNEEYTISTDAWAAMTPKTTASAGHAQVLLNGKIYCFGGKTAAAATGDTILEIYDIAGDTWSSGTALPTSPSVTATSNKISCATDGTDIYLSYAITGGGYAFLRYNVSTDSYTVKTTMDRGIGDTWGQLFFFHGAIYAWESNAWLHYNISSDTWTVVGVSPALGTTDTMLAGLSDNGVLIAQAKHYTFFYYLAEAVTDYILGFRKRLEADLGLYNAETLSTGVDTICVAIGDTYGIYVNDTTLTGSYEVEVYG